jgi:hypothetical protein
MKNSSNNISNFVKSILNKESSLKEKCIYFLPALISILYLFYQFYFSFNLVSLIYDGSVSIFMFNSFLIRLKLYIYYGSVSIFIFSSILILFKNYSISKKLDFTSFPLFLIIFFWSYDLLINFDFNYGIKYWIILIFQIYLFLNLYLDKEFNILNISSVFTNNTNFLIINKIVNKFKSSTLAEKILYFFPLILSLSFLLDNLLFLFGFDFFFRKIFTGDFNKTIFFISSGYCAYISYSHHKKITSIAILFSYICFYWLINAGILQSLIINHNQMGIYFLIFIGYLNLVLQIYLYLIFFLDDKIDFKNLTNKIFSNKKS